jgi:hypothetical protein
MEAGADSPYHTNPALDSQPRIPQRFLQPPYLPPLDRLPPIGGACVTPALTQDAQLEYSVNSC